MSLLAFGLGAMMAGSIRYGAYARHFYDRGRAAALAEFQAEAVKECHARWVYSDHTPDAVQSFEWYPTRPEWTGDSGRRIPGEVVE